MRDADDGPASWFLNSLVTTRIAGDDTDGAFAVLEHLLPPTYETPYHIHHNEDEMSYLLDGEINQNPLLPTLLSIDLEQEARLDDHEERLEELEAAVAASDDQEVAPLDSNP